MTSPDADRRYIIVGPGAVGGVIAAELVRAGTDVLLVARGADLEALTRDGLSIRSPSGVESISIPVVGDVSDIEFAESDILLITTKSQDADDFLEDVAWRPVPTAAGPGATVATTIPVVTAQNGLNTERAALRWFDRVYGATGGFAVNKEKPGEVIAYREPNRGTIWIGRFPEGEDELSSSIARDLAASGALAVESVPNIQAWKAWKLIHNTANVLDPLFAKSELRTRAQTILEHEYRAVLAKAGVTPANPETDTRLDPALLRDSGGLVDGRPRPGNSTLQSYNRGTTLETDYLNGEVVLLGRLYGVPTPLNRALQVRLQSVAAAGLSAPVFTDGELEKILDAVGVAVDA